MSSESQQNIKLEIFLKFMKSKITIRNIIASFIVIRILWCLYNLYFDGKTLFYLANHADIFPVNVLQLVLILLVEVMFFSIIFFDVTTIIKLRKKDNTFIKNGLIASIGFSIYFLLSVMMRIIDLVDLNKQLGAPGMPWYFHYYFSYWDIMFVFVFLITLTQIVFQKENQISTDEFCRTNTC